jgi:hypothetical protein
MTIQASRPVTKAATRSSAPEEFSAHPARGRFNAAFFSVMGGYINGNLRKHKARAFAASSSTSRPGRTHRRVGRSESCAVHGRGYSKVVPASENWLR